MRFFKAIVALLMLVSVAFGSVTHASTASCAPQPRQYGALHISWIDCQTNNDEVVVIENGSNGDLNLTGYQIVSAVGDQTFTFSATTPINSNCCVIKAHDVLRVHSGPKNDQAFSDPRDLHWLTKKAEPYIANVWNDDGDKALLMDPHGAVIDTYQYP